MVVFGTKLSEARTTAKLNCIAAGFDLHYLFSWVCLGLDLGMKSLRLAIGTSSFILTMK